jgi:hypothetical protein
VICVGLYWRSFPLLNCLYSDSPLDSDGLECVTRLRFDGMSFRVLCRSMCLKKERAVLFNPFSLKCRSQWPRGLRSRSVVTRLLGLRVRITPGAWISVSYECFVLFGKGLCVGLITRPEECYRAWGVYECDREASTMRSPRPTSDC